MSILRIKKRIMSDLIIKVSFALTFLTLSFFLGETISHPIKSYNKNPKNFTQLINKLHTRISINQCCAVFHQRLFHLLPKSWWLIRTSR